LTGSAAGATLSAKHNDGGFMSGLILALGLLSVLAFLAGKAALVPVRAAARAR